MIDEVTRWSIVCLAGGDCRLFRRCDWVWLGVDQVTYFGDGIDRVIGWWQFGGEPSASPNPCGSHSEAFGSVYVACRAVADEHHLLRAVKSCRIEGITEDPVVGFGVADLF